MSGLRFVCFAKNFVHNIVGTEINFIAINAKTEEMYLYRVYLWGPFKRWTFLCMHCCKHTVTKLNPSFKAVFKERDSIQEVFLFDEKDQVRSDSEQLAKQPDKKPDSFALLYQTHDSVKMIQRN